MVAEKLTLCKQKLFGPTNYGRAKPRNAKGNSCVKNPPVTSGAHKSHGSMGTTLLVVVKGNTSGKGLNWVLLKIWGWFHFGFPLNRPKRGTLKKETLLSKYAQPRAVCACVYVLCVCVSRLVLRNRPNEVITHQCRAHVGCLHSTVSSSRKAQRSRLVGMPLECFLCGHFANPI